VNLDEIVVASYFEEPLFPQLCYGVNPVVDKILLLDANLLLFKVSTPILF